jgi:hypothetical protein
VCNGRGCPAEEIFVIPAQRYPDGYPDGGEPATDPFVLDLVALIPTQRSARPEVPAPRPVPRPDPVLVQQMAPRPRRPPIVGRLTAVVLGGVLVAVLLLLVMLLL